MFGPSTYWTALNFILDVFLLQMLFDVLIAVFVSDDPFIFSSWVESGNDSTLQHRSEQTSIITSPRAPIGNKSEINRSAMQVTIDQFILVQTVNHNNHILLAHCDSIVWPRWVAFQLPKNPPWYDNLKHLFRLGIIHSCTLMAQLPGIYAAAPLLIYWACLLLFYEYYIFFSYTEWLWAICIPNHRTKCQQSTYTTSEIDTKGEICSLASTQYQRVEETFRRMCKAHSYPVTLWVPQRSDLVLVSYEWCVYTCTLWCK